MKYYPTITKNEIPEDDFQAWHYLARIMKEEPQKGEAENKNFEGFIKQLDGKYPELPKKMVWGNYLISEIYENRISLSIDYEDKDEMITQIVKIAKNNQLVVFEPKSEKIYRP